VIDSDSSTVVKKCCQQIKTHYELAFTASYSAGPDGLPQPATFAQGFGAIPDKAGQ
jgi:hypothetical protein